MAHFFEIIFLHHYMDITQKNRALAITLISVVIIKVQTILQLGWTEILI